MGKSSAPSLKQYAKEADACKKKLDKLQKECTSTLKNASLANRGDKLKAHYQENNMADLEKKVSNMSKADEPTKMSNFDKKKADELKRLEKMMTQVQEMEKTLEPDETEDDYYNDEDGDYHRKIKEELKSEEDLSEEEEMEEEGEDEMEEEGEEEMEEEGEEEMEEEGEEEMEEEGEDEEEFEEGLSEEESSEYEEEVEEEETDDEVDGLSPDRRIDYEVLHDYSKQEEGDLTVKKGEIVTLISIRDDGWWECETINNDRGYLPSTYLKEYNKYADLMQDDEEATPTSPRSGKALWGSVKKALAETSATDVLHALGAAPAGFREPTSARLLEQDEKFTHLNMTSVKLSNSNLFYRDLFYNPTTRKLRPRTARIQKVVTLVEARNIPLPGANTKVISRLARVSLFDGSKFLTNIVTVQAQCTDKEGKVWKFPARLACLESPECFVRINEPNNKTGILIELSVVFTKELKKGGEKTSELSCGWAFKPMFDETGSLLLNKEYEVNVNGGTPYEKNLEVDPNIARRTSSKFMSMLSRNKQPMLTLKTTAANNEQKERFDVLPNAVAGKVCYLHPMALYRHHLATVLIRDRENLQSTESVFDPFLLHFPSMLEQPDLTDVLLDKWDSKLRAKSRTDRFTLLPKSPYSKDLDILTATLVATFNEWIYPLLHTHLPPFKPGQPEAMEERTTAVNKYLSVCQAAGSAVAALFDSSIKHKPFDMEEVSYSVVGRHCLTTI